MAKTDLFARIASGDMDMGQMPSSIIAEREKSFKVNVETVMPSVGVPLAVEQVALVKGTDKKEQALKFIDWFGSADVQGEWAQQFNSMPVNKAAAAKAKPEVVEFFDGLKQQDIDWNFVQENMGAWVEKDRARVHDCSSAAASPSASAAPPDRLPMIRLENIEVTFGDFIAIPEPGPPREAGRVLHAAGPLRLRENDGAAHPGRVHRAVRRRRSTWTARTVTRLPSDKRQVGMVFQNYALFPSMSVWENIAFGLRVRKEKSAESDRLVRDIAQPGGALR